MVDKLAGYPLGPLASLALATGMRRGELLGLRWSDIDLDRAILRVERSLEEPARACGSKCKRRATAGDLCRCRRAASRRCAATVRASSSNASPSACPASCSMRCGIAISALIASGLDVKSISRRLGHATPVVALTVYAHLFHKTDAAAATVIEAAMRTGPER